MKPPQQAGEGVDLERRSVVAKKRAKGCPDVVAKKRAWEREHVAES